MDFEDYCKGTIDAETGMTIFPPCRSNYTEINQICDRCRKVMYQEMDCWQKASTILKNHDFPSVEESRKLVVGQEEHIEIAKNKALAWDTN
jgi:hypothetical protein|tara:strand:+ start:84 stop:356 length:273 start_codon:yes stop_codon:yes gene_type:complete